jgi:hypothetical protein
MSVNQKNRFQPRVENLEQRALMSVDPTFFRQAGLLFIQGTAHGDTINVGLNSAGDVTVNGTDVGRNSDIKSIYIADGSGGHGGGDTITVGKNVSAMVWVGALNGGDTITLNNDTSRDMVIGGKGDKILFAGGAPFVFNMGYTRTSVGAHEIDLV